MSKNKVPACPTPTIDAVMEKYRKLLNWFGCTPEDVARIEAGLEITGYDFNGGLPPVYAIMGLPVKYVVLKPRRMVRFTNPENN